MRRREAFAELTLPLLQRAHEHEAHGEVGGHQVPRVRENGAHLPRDQSEYVRSPQDAARVRPPKPGRVREGRSIQHMDTRKIEVIERNIISR